jgi:hypothetical protein
VGGWAGGVVNDGSFHMRISRLVCDCLSHNEQPYLHKYTLSLTTALIHVRLAVRVGRLRLNVSVARIAMSPQQLFDMSNSTTNMTLSFIQPQTRLNIACKIRNTHELSQPRHFTTSPSLTTTSLPITPNSPHTGYKPRALPTPPLPNHLQPWRIHIQHASK